MATIGLRFLLIVFLLLPTMAQAEDDYVIFNSNSYKSDNLSALPQWLEVIAKWEKEKEKMEACNIDFAACETHLMIGWNAFLSRVETLPTYERVSEVNRYANERNNEKMGANWQSPLEFLTLQGSATDQSILKYFMLREVGFSAEDVRLVIVTDAIRFSRSVLVTIKLDNEIMVLSNKGGAVLSQRDFAAFVPIVSFNENARWVHVLKQVI